MEQEGAIASERGPSENNRIARFYRLTKAGRKQLEAEARRRALLTFGSMAALKEDYRDQQVVPALEHPLQDVRVALRRMWKTPGFTGAATGVAVTCVTP